MNFTPEQLRAIGERQTDVQDKVIEMLISLPQDPSLSATANLMCPIDGLVSAIAVVAEVSGLYPSHDQKQKFAEEIRSLLLRSMNVARDELKASGVLPNRLH